MSGRCIANAGAQTNVVRRCSGGGYLLKRVFSKYRTKSRSCQQEISVWRFNSGKTHGRCVRRISGRIGTLRICACLRRLCEWPNQSLLRAESISALNKWIDLISTGPNPNILENRPGLEPSPARMTGRLHNSNVTDIFWSEHCL